MNEKEKIIDDILKSKEVKEQGSDLCAKAKKLYEEKKFAEALEIYKEAAETNDPEALYMLGYCYYYGLGISDSEKENNTAIATEYFFKAAELGHANAQCYAGLFYMSGTGVEKDEEKALYWFKKSADLGSTQALNNLGYYTSKGIGVKDDTRYEESFNWYKKSADLGDPTGQTYAAKAYLSGRGVARDEEEAVRLFKIAADKGIAEAQFCLGECYDDGDGVEENDVVAFSYSK